MNESCMGGFCARRDQCPHYRAASLHYLPAERLCLPGQDGWRAEARDGRVRRVSVFPVTVRPAGV